MRNEIYDLRQYWLDFYQNKRPYLVSDVIWDYYCDIFEKTLKWKTDYDIFVNFLTENKIETLTACQNHINNIAENLLKKINLEKLFSKSFEPYTDYITNTPDGYYFKIDLCDALFNYFVKNDIVKETTWSDFVETDDGFINHKLFRYYIYNRTNYPYKFMVNKQRLDNILDSDTDLIYNLKNIKHTLFYTGDSILFKINNENDIPYLKKEITPFLEIEGESIHTSMYKKETLTFNKRLSRIAVLDDITTGILDFRNYNLIDYQMYLPQIQKLYLKKDITENDLIYGYHDRLCKFDIPLSLINID
jgi:hypothetical protein